MEGQSDSDLSFPEEPSQSVGWLLLFIEHFAPESTPQIQPSVDDSPPDV